MDASAGAGVGLAGEGQGGGYAPTHSLPRFHGLISVLALAVSAKRGPLARVLHAKLSVPEDIHEEGDNATGGGSSSKRERTGTYRTIDGLALPKKAFKFVLHSGMLFCFSISSSPDEANLVECLPLSLCDVTVDDGKSTGDEGPDETGFALSLSSASSGIWMVTLYFKTPAIMKVWRDAMGAASSAHVNSVSRSTPRPSQRSSVIHMNERRPSHRAWAEESPSSTLRSSGSVSEMTPRDVSQSMSELNRTRKDLVRHSHEISSCQGTFYQRLEAQSHVFGADARWRCLKLVDPSGAGTGGSLKTNLTNQDKPDENDSSASSDTLNRYNRHGFDPIHHTRASAEERKRVAKDKTFFSSLKYHPRLRELALGDDSPQFQKHIAALSEQVRGVKHNSQKLLSSSAAYFAAGEAFCAAGHAFAQDMIRYAPYQRTEWQLAKGVLAMPAKSTAGGTGLNAKNEQKLSKDLGEDDERTRKLAIVTEELTLLMRESIVHLEVALSQQHEALIKPLEHLVQVESKSCKLSMERYEREKKLYLAALAKFQGAKVKKGAKKAALKKEGLQLEAATHAKIFEDARFEAAMKLGSFDAIRDTRYLEQITQWLHVQLSFFAHGEKLLGDRGSYLVDMYSRLAASNESTAVAMHKLRSEYEAWKRQNLDSAATAVAGSTMRSMAAAASFHDGAEDDIFSDDDMAGDSRRSIDAKSRHKRGSLVASGAGGRHGRGEAFYEGYLMIRSKRWKGKWKRRWFTCDGKQFYYCKTAEQDAVRANEVDLTMASIRPARNVDRAHCFEVVTSKPGGGMLIMFLQAASADEMQAWIQAVTAGISAQLDALAPSSVQATKGTGGSNSSSNGKNTADDLRRMKEKEAQRQRQLKMILAAPGNMSCADCGGDYNLEWCSLNLGVVLCLECAGVHRSLGVHISQCRSFNLDVLDESILSMFGIIGNTLANGIWEKELEGPSAKPHPKSKREVKEAYIKRKYVDRDLVGTGSNPNVQVRGADLIDAAAHGDMHRLIKHVAYKTDLDFVSKHGATALSAAAHRGHPGPITLLLLNHAKVNKCGKAGWSPLHAAAYGGKQEAVRLLMAKGGDEMAKEQHGQTPIDIAVRCGHETCVILMGGEFPSVGTDRRAGRGGGFDSHSRTNPKVAPTPAGTMGRRAFIDYESLPSDTSGNDDGSRKPSTPAWKQAARRSSFRREQSKKSVQPSPASSAVAADAPRRTWVGGDVVQALYDFAPESHNELELVAGRQYVVLKKESSTGWTFVKNGTGEKGLVPSTYITLEE